VVEHLILRLRQKHPAWGARKLRHRLLTQGYRDLPSVSTMTAILHRHSCIDPPGDTKAPSLSTL
jgi:hypothetical protein